MDLIKKYLEIKNKLEIYEKAKDEDEHIKKHADKKFFTIISLFYLFCLLLTAFIQLTVIILGAKYILEVQNIFELVFSSILIIPILLSPVVINLFLFEVTEDHLSKKYDEKLVEYYLKCDQSFLEVHIFFLFQMIVYPFIIIETLKTKKDLKKIQKRNLKLSELDKLQKEFDSTKLKIYNNQKALHYLKEQDGEIYSELKKEINTMIEKDILLDNEDFIGYRLKNKKTKIIQNI